MDVIIASFDSISEVNMDYTITMYLYQYWRDDRLSWPQDVLGNEMILSGDFSERIWLPDTFIANDKQSFLHDVTEKNKMIRISRDGQVSYGMRFTSTLACHMDLRNYPLDSQNCTIEIESYGYTTTEVLMKWNQPRAVYGVEEAEVPQFKLRGYQAEDRIVRTATGAYQRLSLVFILERSVGYFVLQTYTPCMLIVMLSWVSFWINHESTAARVALGITTVLTMTTISTGVRQSLPRISYVKSIDIYFVMCFIFVFAALLEYAAVNYSYWGNTGDTKLNEWRSRKYGMENRENSTSAADLHQWHISRLTGENLDRDMPPRCATSYNRGQNEFQPIQHIGKFTSTDPSNFLRFRNKINDDNKKCYIRKTRNADGQYLNRTSSRHYMHMLSRRARSVFPSFRVRDVNIIDKYSRISFPVFFVAFNVAYWVYYIMMQ